MKKPIWKYFGYGILLASLFGVLHSVGTLYLLSLIVFVIGITGLSIKTYTNYSGSNRAIFVMFVSGILVTVFSNTELNYYLFIVFLISGIMALDKDDQHR